MSQNLSTDQLLAFFGNSKRRAAAISVGLLLAAAALWQFLAVPQQEALDQARQEAATRLAKQEAMEKLIRHQPLTEQAVERLSGHMSALEAEGYLTPLLNSYAMRCKSLVDPLADKSGLSLVQYAEHSQRMLQVPKIGAPEQLQARQLITCIGSGSYRQLTETIEAIEDTYPLAVLTALRILPGTDHTSHTLQLVLEWPTKGKRRSDLLPAKMGGRR